MHAKLRELCHLLLIVDVLINNSDCDSDLEFFTKLKSEILLRYQNRFKNYQPYYKSLYFQQMLTPKHLLNRNNSADTKSLGRLHNSDISKVRSICFMEITNPLLCIFRDLHKIPHGTIRNTEIDGTLDALSTRQDFQTVTKFDSSQSFHQWDEGALKCFYPGSQEIATIVLGDEQKYGTLRYILEHGKPGVRDAPAKKGFSCVRRISFGFSQPQGTNSPDSVCFDGHCKPHLNTIPTQQMPQEVKECVATIMSGAFLVLKKSFPDNYPQPFHCGLRGDLFGKKLANLLSPSCVSQFEFVDMILETNSMLLRHMDCMNDDKAGYNHGVSYSFFSDDGNGNSYRITLVLVSRLVCGQCIKKLKSNCTL